MNIQLTREYQKNISKALLGIELLSENSLTMDDIKEFVAGEEFNNCLNIMVEKNDYTCESTYILIEKIINKITSIQNPKKWLMEAYQYVLNKSFPHTLNTLFDRPLCLSFEIYLTVLREISNIQKFSNDATWQSKYPLVLLSHKEIDSLETPEEYYKFQNAFNQEFIYEMMKLNQELLGYNTLDHICGVHHISMILARQLKLKGLPVDLGKVSGASAGHDIGKYGCKGSEVKRVPYLHYYYTDLWFTKHDISHIRSIALNHSTWDLELENLPIESLILIYSDFRVKNLKDSSGWENMHVFTLKDSFEVILNKLDKVDEVKLKRYKKVYSKLRDFENFMINMGIKVSMEDNDTFNDTTPIVVETPSYSLMHGTEITENLKFFSIDSNIRLMNKLRTETSLSSILDFARSETDWKNLRNYLRVFEEYSTYLTQKQKLITLKFLYEELTHPEEDIRKKSAELIGVLIAQFDEEYRKELPPDARLDLPDVTSTELLRKYMQLLLHPDHKIIQEHKKWIGYSIAIMIGSLFDHSRSNAVVRYRTIILNFYEIEANSSNDVKLYLLNAANFIPVSERQEGLEILYDYLLEMIESKNILIRLSALDVSRNMLNSFGDDCIFARSLKSKILNKISYSRIPAENFLRKKIINNLDTEINIKNEFENFCKRDIRKIPDIYLSNLKTATDWIIKRIQVELLLDHSMKHPKESSFHTSMHYCNLLKVSAIESVRNSAGDALVEIAPQLSPEQRNDVAVELMRALEIEGYKFAEFIPYSLGQVLLYLRPVELNEVIEDLINKIKQSEPRIQALLLRTMGIVISNYPNYRYLFQEDESSYRDRLTRMLGVLLNGLVNSNIQVKQMAFRVIGKDIFGSQRLDMKEKHNIYQMIGKKLLTLLVNDKEEELTFLTKAASLNHLYRFISEYTCTNGEIALSSSGKIAFFPGTFDPFSLSHKEIVKAIRDKGMEVYLAVDEFSWSKQTHPHMIRRNIISMSIADELGVFLFPEDIPVNISNDNNLKGLKELFPGSQIYMVAGSDVLLNASAYKKNKTINSIHSFSHIIFKRNGSLTSKKSNIKEVIKKIDGEVIMLSLEPQYEDISSTQIRDYIDKNKDISSLIDPLAQSYIYEYGFYQREPQYKSPIQTISINVEVVDNLTDDFMHDINTVICDKTVDVKKKLIDFSKKPSCRIILLRSLNESNKIIGFSLIHWLRISDLYQELQNTGVTEFIRENATGRIVLISGVFIDECSRIKNLEQILVTETLSYCVARDYDYALYNNSFFEQSLPTLEDILELQGFIKIPDLVCDYPFFAVNMSAPCTLNLDIKTIIKEPFRSNSIVNAAIKAARRRLQEALTKLYPGNLVLSFNRNMLYETIIKKICSENGVTTVPQVPRFLGEAMCVPFGNILKRNIVPNTITKSLHTEKYFEKDLKSYSIRPFPNYLTLESQMKMIHSFDKPIILVDDILHKGYRMRALDPILKKEDVMVQKIVVGILSGRGKELMDIQDRSVDSAYYIPKLKVWFNESLLYPFMGGDTVWQGDYPERNLIPSINLILPYASPTFIKGASTSSINNLSRVCIENAFEIISALEQEYRNLRERSLTLGLLGQIFTSPRCPDHGYNMHYDLNINTSYYLKNDLELLSRIEYLLNSDGR